VKGISLLAGGLICSVCTRGKLLVWKLEGETLTKVSSAESGIGRVVCMDASLVS